MLYVEDDCDIAEVTIMVLQDIGGFEVEHCYCGEKALERLSIFKPQLILMDVMMPGLDGPQTLQKLRQIPNGEDIPVIFITAKAQTHEQASYKEMGSLGVIIKPYEPTTLCAQIEALWNAR